VNKYGGGVDVDDDADGDNGNDVLSFVEGNHVWNHRKFLGMYYLYLNLFSNTTYHLTVVCNVFREWKDEEKKGGGNGYYEM